MNQKQSSHMTIWDPDLRLSASRTVKNKYLLLISYTHCGIFVIAA